MRWMLLGAFLYLFVTGITYQALHTRSEGVCMSREDFQEHIEWRICLANRDLADSLSAIFWPISLPMYLGNWTVNTFREAIQ